MPLLSVIIVNYNTREMTLDCLRTLTQNLVEDSIQSEIFVVDNASADGSIEAIAKDFPSVHVIASPTNRGFGAANNIAMEKATGDYFLLINTDAFPKPHAVQALLTYLEQHPNVGVVGPRLLNRDGSLQTSCYPFPSPGRAWAENLWLSSLFPNSTVVGDYRRWAHDRERDVAWVIGACLLLRREVFRQVGGFDEKFFMYSEEADWQKRIREAGWLIAFTPTGEVTHFAGASGNAEKPRINRHFFESLDYYERKHHGLLGLMMLRAAMFIGCILRVIAWSAVWLVMSRKRDIARAKVHLLSWLAVRQSTYWRAAGRPQ